MGIDEFLATIYLGDRACKAITLNGWDERVSIMIDEISRIRSATGIWEFYNDENIEDGLLVFTGVHSASLSPQGLLPSDEIEIRSIEKLSSDGKLFRVKFCIYGRRSHASELQEMELDIIAEQVHLEDPKRPDVWIVE